VKIGDLAVWSKYASEWSNAPAHGDLAGVVVRIIKPPSRHQSRAIRIELHAEGENFIVGEEYVEIISESR